MTVAGGQPQWLEPLNPGDSEGRTVEEQQAALGRVPATIEEIFELLEAARSAEWVEVEYDPQLGYPRRAHIDGDLSIEDDELEIRASLLHVAGQTSADPVEPSADTAAVLAAWPPTSTNVTTMTCCTSWTVWAGSATTRSACPQAAVRSPLTNAPPSKQACRHEPSPGSRTSTR